MPLVKQGAAAGLVFDRARGFGGRNFDHLCLRIEGFDLDAARAELEAAGVPVGEAGVRYGAGGEAMSLYLRDPDGNPLELRG